MAREAKVAVTTKVHDDGAVSAHVEHADGTKQVIIIGRDNALRDQFLAHGLKAKVQAAAAAGPAQVDKLEEAFAAGRWTLVEGAGKPKGTALVRALAQLRGDDDIKAAEAFVKGLSRAEQAKLRANPAVAARILEIEAEDKKDSGADALADFLGTGQSAAA